MRRKSVIRRPKVLACTLSLALALGLASPPAAVFAAGNDGRTVECVTSRESEAVEAGWAAVTEADGDVSQADDAAKAAAADSDAQDPEETSTGQDLTDGSEDPEDPEGESPDSPAEIDSPQESGDLAESEDGPVSRDASDNTAAGEDESDGQDAEPAGPEDAAEGMSGQAADPDAAEKGNSAENEDSAADTESGKEADPAEDASEADGEGESAGTAEDAADPDSSEEGETGEPETGAQPEDASGGSSTASEDGTEGAGAEASGETGAGKAGSGEAGGVNSGEDVTEGTGADDSAAGETAADPAMEEAAAEAAAEGAEAAAAFASGTGTKADPFLITTAEGLAAFAVLVDEGTTFEGQYVALGADIDLSGTGNWNPIGAEGASGSNKDRLFNGTFDGNGHAVSGLSITGALGEWQNAGLFSTLNSGARIRDLEIRDIDLNMTAEGTARLGGLAGDTVSNSSGTAAVADSVSVTGQISLVSENDSMLFAGGLFGRMMAGGVIMNSWTDVSVDARSLGAGSPSAYAGGILGMGGNNLIAANIAAFGDVTSATPQGENLVGYAGGIAGMYPGRLYNAFSAGDVTYGRLASSEHSWGGALVGQLTTKGSSAYVYYASDAALTLQAWDGDSHSDSPLAGASGSSTKNSSFLTIEAAGTPSRGEMYASAFAETMNANLPYVYQLLQEAGSGDPASLREWSHKDGRVVPEGGGYTYTEPGPGPGPEPADAYRDGTYEGTGIGRNGKITMRVVIEDGRIKSIEPVTHSENEGYWEDALAITEQMVALQTAEVDGVAGATLSCDGIRQAVANALEKALVPENAEAFQSGQGTAANPFIIMTADQLSAFAASVDEGTTYEGQYIELGADIDLSGIACWNPIGAEGAPNSNKDKIFNGSFDGAGHEIRGMLLSGAHEDWQNAGLFSTLHTGAKVRNLSIADASIDLETSGTTRAGLLAGDTIGNSGGTAAVVDSVSAAGSVRLSAENDSMLFAGGLFGRMMAGAIVSNSWTDADVDAQALGAGYPSAYAGGIVGMGGNKAVLANTAAFGDVVSSTPQGDSLVGFAGGLAGMYSGYLLNSHAQGAVTYGRAASSPHSWGGALVGEMTTNGTYADVYYASDVPLTLKAFDGESCTESALTGASGSSTKTTSFLTVEAKESMPRTQMAEASFADALNANLQEVFTILKGASLDGALTLRNWTASGGRVLPEGENWYNAEPDAGIFAGGTGTQSDPYLIETAQQLFAFAASPGENLDYEGYFIALGADIDLSESDWTPVGLSEYGFAGTFDGQGHTIRGMHRGTEQDTAALPQDQPYFALFSVLERTAVVKNVTLSDVLIHASYPASSYVAGIAGYMAGAQDDSRAGARIDNCHVSGSITTVQDRGNLFLGGIAAYQYKGAITNCSTDLQLSGTVLGEALAEVGGIVALDNRGLVANCYSTGDIYGSGSREDDKEGMAVISSLAAVDAGDVVGCYGSGSHTTKEFSNYAGMVSGWVTGIGKAYSCWYDQEAVMTVNGERVNPPETIGTKVPAGVSEDAMVYSGGIVDDLHGYTAETYAAVADALNEKFAAYPIDLSRYGLPADALSKWTYTDGNVTFSDEKGTVTYVQPEAELYVKPEAALRDGTWYGRDKDKKSVVRITVENTEITETAVLSGEESGEAYEAALETAKEKATYGDFSHYEAADPSRFGGGKGTKASPYLIKNAQQLRYLSTSINEDTDWEGVWFRQTADISLSGIDWIPIGWALEAEIDNQEETFAAYPFCGNYDGNGYTISGLTVGSKEAPSPLLTLGLFGLTTGEYETNEVPTDDVRRVVLRNIHLRDAAVYGNARYQLYAGTLAGSCQYGVEIDRCDAEGTVYAQTSDSHCRAGGLIASGLRGKMTNCWTDVDVTALTDTGRVYGAGLIATSNRLTIVNAFTLGDVTGGSSSNNTTYLGGLDGMEGGVHINCYSKGNVTSTKTTAGIGANNGLLGGISVNKASYYNTDASLTVQGSPAEMKASGANYSGATDEAAGRSGEEIASQAFADELNANITQIAWYLAEVNAELSGGSHLVYYTGDGSDLASWILKDGVVQFAGLTQKITGVESVYNVTYGDKAFTLGAKAKTKLSYSSSNKAVAAVTSAGGKVTIMGAGTAVITIKTAGNRLYDAATAKVTVKVAKAKSTVTLKNKAATYTGKSISIAKAVVKGSTGKVTYKYYSDAKCTNAVKARVKAGTYYVKATVAADKNYRAATSKAAKLIVKKAAQKVKAVTSSRTVSFAKLKKKNQTAAIKATITGKGKVTFAKTAGTSSITVTRAGKVIVKKGLKKGTYTIKVKASIAETANYKAASAVKAVKIIVK